MVELTMEEGKEFKRAEYFEHLPHWFKKFSDTCIVIAGVGILTGLVMSLTGLDFPFYKTMIVGSYAVGLFTLGLFLSVLAGTVSVINAGRHKEGLSTFGLNKHGKSEGGGYLFNQLINGLYVLLGGALMAMGVMLIHHFCC